MTVEQVPMFRTSDDAVFPTAEEAEKHDRFIANDAKIDAFINGKQWGRGQDTRVRNILREFLAQD